MNEIERMRAANIALACERLDGELTELRNRLAQRCQEHAAETAGLQHALKTAAVDLVYPLAQLRHLYSQMSNGHVANCPAAARGLLGPSIEQIERALRRLTPEAPPDVRGA